MIGLLVAVGITTGVLSVVQLITAWYGRRALFGNDRGHGTEAYQGSFSSSPRRSRANPGCGRMSPHPGVFLTTHYAKKGEYNQ